MPACRSNFRTPLHPMPRCIELVKQTVVLKIGDRAVLQFSGVIGLPIRKERFKFELKQSVA